MWWISFLCLALCAPSSIADSLYYPGDKTPPFTVPTLRGSFTNTGSGPKPPVVFYRYDERSLFIKAEWTTNSSILDFVKHDRDSSKIAHFVFFCTPSPKTCAQLLHDRLHQVAPNEPQLHERCHFVTAPLESVDPWIQEVFHQWKCIDHGCGSDNVRFSQKGDAFLVADRLDGRYDWVPSMHLLTSDYPLAFVQDTCNSSAPSGLELRYKVPGSFKLAPWLADAPYQISEAPRGNYSGMVMMTSDQGCDYYSKMKFAKEHGAAGLILYAAAGSPVAEIKCEGKECDYAPIDIPATMISYEDAKTAIAALQHGVVTLTLNTTQLDHFYFMSDYFGNLAEGGWFLYPSLMFLEFETQWFDYTAALARRIAEPATIISIFKDQKMQGAAGANTTVTLPSYDELRHYTGIEIYGGLTCDGRFDLDCAIWDRTTSLTVCCEGQEGTPYCDYELGRWITPFRRRIGKWLTNITPLMPLLKSSTGKCSFAMKTDPWAQPWYVNIQLRLKGRVSDCVSARECSPDKIPAGAVVAPNGDVLAPSQLVPVVTKGATFDQHYNNRSAVLFKVPNRVRSVRVASVITGHGSDDNGCGEFCVTKHVLTMNSKANASIEFSTAGTPLGCAMNVRNGVLPNEHGTWLYGRDGWCDGQEVDPWVIDITREISLDSAVTNSILYRGYFNDKTPNPKHNPGYISVYIEVIYYTAL